MTDEEILSDMMKGFAKGIIAVKKTYGGWYEQGFCGCGLTALYY